MSKDFNVVEWAGQTNIYEVNTRQYTPEGTLNAFATHLPRLKEMGVDTLWFMPLQPIGKMNRKGSLGSYYSIGDYTSFNPEFGSESDFKILVETAHRFGMKIIIDWVANHTSCDHVWTKSHPEFFSRNEQGDFLPPYPDWEDVIHLDYNNLDLRVAMVDAMKYWLQKFHIDGFRCDMAHLVPLDFWMYARTELEKEKALFWLAETENANYHEVFDATYTWEFLHVMESYWRKETGIYGLDAVLYKYEQHFPRNAIRMYFTSNHDENSHSGSEYERLGEAAYSFAVFCATWGGIPLIYSGQELPVKRRLRFFDKDQIEWSGNCDLHDFYKTLLLLHNNHPTMNALDEETKPFRVATDAGGEIFSFIRKKGEREVFVLLNLSANNDFDFTIIDERVTGKFRNEFTKEITDFSETRNLTLRAWDYRVFVK